MLWIGKVKIHIENGYIAAGGDLRSGWRKVVRLSSVTVFDGWVELDVVGLQVG
jgi:hypothetical protein